jgi:predicted nuclease of restriction endonuclease-like (RecB) superfamily
MQNVSINILSDKISKLLDEARKSVLQKVNQTMVLTYFEIGRMIIEEEQTGKQRAEYGKYLLENLSQNLIEKFGKGFSVTNLKQMRQFFVVYYNFKSVNEDTPISQTLSDQFKLSWSHYLKLMRIDDELERKFYETESYKNNWSLRELERQYDSALFTRLALSKNKEEILELALKGNIIESPKDVVKDPFILEFIGLPEKDFYSESELEQKIIDKLENFLLELGSGFTFVGRQTRITFDDKHFRIDLVFYNRILKCFVLIDLKVGELKHQDIGQMQMYVNYYDRKVKLEDENKTIGIILCQNKSEAVVEFTLPENNTQIFASKYLTVLPSKESLIKLIASS